MFYLIDYIFCVIFFSVIIYIAGLFLLLYFSIFVIALLLILTGSGGSFYDSGGKILGSSGDDNYN